MNVDSIFIVSAGMGIRQCRLGNVHWALPMCCALSNRAYSWSGGQPPNRPRVEFDAARLRLEACSWTLSQAALSPGYHFGLKAKRHDPMSHLTFISLGIRIDLTMCVTGRIRVQCCCRCHTPQWKGLPSRLAFHLSPSRARHKKWPENETILFIQYNFYLSQWF